MSILLAARVSAIGIHIILWIGIEAGKNNLNILPGLALHAHNADPEKSKRFARGSSR